MDSDSCRCCLKLNNENEMRDLFVFDEYEKSEIKSTLSDKMAICIPELNILDIDPYSSKICLQCVGRLEDAYSFRMLCIKSDQKLRLAITNAIKVEIKDESNEIDSQERKDMETLSSLNPISVSDFDLEQLFCISTLNKDKKPHKKLRNNLTVRSKIRKERNSQKNDTIPKRTRNPARFNEFGKRIRIRVAKIICDICGYKTYTKFEVEQHMRVHTGERPFTCEVCGMSFKTKAAVKKHALRHRINPIKKYSCAQCTFTTDYRSDYKRHLRIHAGDLPYPCTMCDRRLPCKGSLSNHYKTYHQDKPHPCTLCDARFRTTGGLQQHTACHYRGSTNVCPVCNRLLSSRKSLKAHMKALHPGEKYPPIQHPTAELQINVQKSLDNK